MTAAEKKAKKTQLLKEIVVELIKNRGDQDGSAQHPDGQASG